MQSRDDYRAARTMSGPAVSDPHQCGSGAGSSYVNTGPGRQAIYNQAGADSRQFNAETIHYHETTRDAEPIPRVVGLPRADPSFIDRADVQELLNAQAAPKGSWVALVGLGGIGKTQLAVRYVQGVRERDSGTWVLWIFAANATRFDESIREVADQVGVPKPQNDKEDILPALQTWLSDPRRQWIIVFDNADEANFLLQPTSLAGSGRAGKPRLECIPRCDHGRILITSRYKDMAREFVVEDNIIEIKPMLEAEAQSLLQKKLGPLYEAESAGRLALALDLIPLALTQAASYIRQKRKYTVEKYLAEMEKSRESRTSLLRQHRTVPQRDREASSSIILTWQTSFEHVYATRRSAAELLALMSFCDRQAIPEMLLHDINDGSEDQDAPRVFEVDQTLSDTLLEEGDSHEDTFDDDIQMLEDLAFVSERDPTTWDMHRLVQDAMEWWLIDNNHVDAAKLRYLHRLDKVMPWKFEDPANWVTFRILAPHVTSASRMSCTGWQMSLCWAGVMHTAASYEVYAGYFVSGAHHAQLALAMHRDFLPGDHSDIANSEDLLLGAMINRGQWSEAEDLGLRIMQSRKITFGAEHLHTLNCMVLLAMVYGHQGRHGEAENLEVEVLHLSKKVLGAEHPDILRSIANLAATYLAQGRLKEAEELQLEVLQLSKRVIGAEHPDSLWIMSNLAATYSDQGRLDEAENLEVEVLKLRKRVLREEHPDTISSIANLAATYGRQGRLEEAEVLQLEVLQSSKRVLGAEHPDTLWSVADLAVTYRRQGRLEEAEKLEAEVLHLRKRVLGAEHPDTMSSMSNLAVTYAMQRRFQEAHDLITVCHEVMTRILGDDHPSTQKASSLLERINKDMQEST